MTKLKEALEKLLEAAHPAYVSDDHFREKLIVARDNALQELESHRLDMEDHIADASKMIFEPELARDQPCGCVVCSCKNQAQCLGCGAKHCGSHEVGEIPNPVYVDHIADAGEMVSLRDQFAMQAMQSIASNSSAMANLGKAGERELVDPDLLLSSAAYAIADAMLKVKEREK